MMELEHFRKEMKASLKEARYIHSIGVEEVCCDMAYIYGYDAKKASVAGILHDCAKNLSDQELLDACEKYNLPVSQVESHCVYLLHSKVGATIAKERYRILDEEIINAITYHTTGRPSMTLLEKIVFTADYIEPYRKPLPRINEIRQQAYTDLDMAVIMILENMLKYLNELGGEIDTMTVQTYEYYKKRFRHSCK